MPLPLPRLRLLRAFALILPLATVGCEHRNADPAQWVVNVKHPHDLAVWNHRHLPEMSEELRAEFLVALKRLDAPTARGVVPKIPSKDPFDPLILKIRGRTVKQVILDGYDARREALVRKSALESGNLAANIARFDEAEDVAKYERFIAFQQSVVSRYEEEAQQIQASRTLFLERFP